MSAFIDKPAAGKELALEEAHIRTMIRAGWRLLAQDGDMGIWMQVSQFYAMSS
jgi:hypothetical protein